MKPIKEIDIVIGICEREGKILLIQRKDKNSMWDKQWEFPGGKIESDELPQDAILREVFEETGLRVLEAVFFLLHHHDWNLEDQILRVHIHCFHCFVDDGEIRLEPKKAYTHAWPEIQEALTYNSLSANQDILQKFIATRRMKLPSDAYGAARFFQKNATNEL